MLSHSTERSNQAAMSHNSKELVSSLVEIKISLGDLSMKEAATSQGGDVLQSQEDVADPMNVDPKDVQESKGDNMIVDTNPKVLEEDATKKAGDAADQAKDPKRAIIEGEGDPQYEWSILTLEDLPMIEANPIDLVDPMVREEPCRSTKPK